MWDFVGIVRSNQRLNMASKIIKILTDEIHGVYRKSTISAKMIELRNLATIAELIIKSAITRNDSIGLHYNSDHPDTDSTKHNIVLQTKCKPVLKRLNHNAI
jgi:L-aspartate oxidase